MYDLNYYHSPIYISGPPMMVVTGSVCTTRWRGGEIKLIYYVESIKWDFHIILSPLFMSLHSSCGDSDALWSSREEKSELVTYQQPINEVNVQ